MERQGKVSPCGPCVEKHNIPTNNKNKQTNQKKRHQLITTKVYKRSKKQNNKTDSSYSTSNVYTLACRVRRMPSTSLSKSLTGTRFIFAYICCTVPFSPNKIQKKKELSLGQKETFKKHQCAQKSSRPRRPINSTNSGCLNPQLPLGCSTMRKIGPRTLWMIFRKEISANHGMAIL